MEPQTTLLRCVAFAKLDWRTALPLRALVLGLQLVRRESGWVFCDGPDLTQSGDASSDVVEGLLECGHLEKDNEVARLTIQGREALRQYTCSMWREAAQWNLSAAGAAPNTLEKLGGG